MKPCDSEKGLEVSSPGVRLESRERKQSRVDEMDGVWQFGAEPCLFGVQIKGEIPSLPRERPPDFWRGQGAQPRRKIESSLFSPGKQVHNSHPNGRRYWNIIQENELAEKPPQELNSLALKGRFAIFARLVAKEWRKQWANGLYRDSELQKRRFRI